VSISKVKGRETVSTLIVLYLLVFLVGTFAGCQGQLPAETPSPTILSSLDEPLTETPSLATPTIDPQVRDAAAEWLRANAIPFETTEPGSGFGDLMPLKELIGDARIVALGEATHGTHEFFQMKHRLVEFLVEEMGFNIFVIEANWPEANLVNGYVRTCEGDEVTLLAGLYFWTWNTQEVLDMIRWMCIRNQDPGDAPEVSFVGFDMQFQDEAIANVTSYLGLTYPN
jgi:erythromycin esterase-like protein